MKRALNQFLYTEPVNTKVCFVALLQACFMFCLSIKSFAAGVCNDVNIPHLKTVAEGYRNIRKVQHVSVCSPEGTVPCLPYRVWVTYSNGQSEYHQVKWVNSSTIAEQEQSDKTKYPVGTEYVVKGYILGDNTTPDGYPVAADVKVVAGGYHAPSNEPVAHTLPLNKVQIIGDNRLTSNRNLAIDEIISWDVTQQLYNYRDTYGLSTEGYTVSNGWDSPTTKLKGHGSGHYMSALAFAYACCNDEVKKDILRKNIIRMVNELRECQERTFVYDESLGRYREARDLASEEELRTMKGTWDAFDEYKKDYKHYGYGYLNAIPPQHPVLIEMYRAYNNNDWVWAPYYTIHKQLAGLIDIATYFDDKEIADKALLIAKDMGLWVWNRLHYRTFVQSEGTQEERRSKPGNRYEMWNMYIAGEVGGMSESLARLSEKVTDITEKERLLEAANFFDSPAFYEPLSYNADAIRTRHANQHIPMIVGALRSYISNANPYYYNLSENFWNHIQGRYLYASGGVGNGEMFRQPYSQILSMATNVTSDNERNLYPSPNINETCCAYNLAKLTKELNCFNPDDAKYMDYYEKVLYNQIIGSLNPTHYMTTYHYAVGLDASKQWGNRTPQESCCGGTGSENHVKYQESVYFVSENTLWVGLYMPTSAKWDEKGVTVLQDCLWPAEKSTIRIAEGSARFVLKLRVPFWATQGFDIKLNGVSVAESYTPSSYVEIPERLWTKSDVVEVVMPFSKYIDFGPDKMETAATGKNQTKTVFEPMWAGTLMYGPLAMTATDINDWDEATIDIKSDLSDIVLNGASSGTGYESNVYSLTCNGIKFLPDYYTDKHSTHYFRINMSGDPSAENKAILLKKINEVQAYKADNYERSGYGYLVNAIDVSVKIYEGNSLSEKQAEEAVRLLDDAVRRLEQRRLDKSSLESSVVDARSKDESLYTWDSYSALESAIRSAENVISETMSQKECDLAEYYINDAVKRLVLASDVDKNLLEEYMIIVQKRKSDQEKWNSLKVKVPEFAPWAPYGYKRLMEQYSVSETIYNNKDKNYSQEDVDKAASALNTAINTMRPGNLAELEDLGKLLAMLSDAKEMLTYDNDNLKKEIEYAEMVVRYVSEGSGTLDMIQNAEKRLRPVLKY